MHLLIKIFIAENYFLPNLLARRTILVKQWNSNRSIKFLSNIKEALLGRELIDDEYLGSNHS